MVLWLVFTIMMGIALAILARPFLRQSSMLGGGQSQDVSLFREQLRELDADVARGAMTQAEAAGTRREIEHRLLAVIKQGKDKAMAESGERGRMIGLTIVLGWLVVGCIGLFAVLRDPVPMPRVIASAPMNAPQAAPEPTAEAPPIGTVDTMIAKLAARLETEPDDHDGWRMLGWSYLRTGNATGAANAFGRALDLNGDDAELHALYGEALVRRSGGRVVPDALAAFDASLSRNPDNPRAGFFKGLAMDQAGDTSGALALWLSILDRSPANADWTPGLIERIRERASATGFDLSGYPALAPQADNSLRLPTEDEIAAAQEMTAEDRGAMIQGMVDGLADRLADDPNDAEGWARLIRSYGVLGQPDKAATALNTAMAAFPAGTAGRTIIEQAGQGLSAQ